MSVTDTDGVAQDHLQAFVRRIESLEDEINALNGDKSEVYKEAKGNGFDTKVLRKVIADRRKDASERNEFDAVYQLYWDAVHGHVRAHVEIIEQFDPETGEIKTAGELVAPGVEAADHGTVATNGAAVPQATNPGGKNVAAPQAHASEQPGNDTGSVSTPAEGGAHSAAIAEPDAAMRPQTGGVETLVANSQPVSGTLDAGTRDGLAGPAIAEDAQLANIKPAANSEPVSVAPPSLTATGDGDSTDSSPDAVPGATNVTMFRTHNPETHFLNSKGLMRLHGCQKPDNCGSEQARLKLCFSCSMQREEPAHVGGAA